MTCLKEILLDMEIEKILNTNSFTECNIGMAKLMGSRVVWVH